MSQSPIVEENRNSVGAKPAHEVFWGEIAPCEHVLQIYGEDNVFLDALEGFVSEGLHGNESVIVIATNQHLSGLEERLMKGGHNLNTARATDLYIELNAEETLAKFMVEGWPDDRLFEQLVGKLLLRARKAARKVRAFGEMVALLWANGNNGATVRLEHLWNRVLARESFPLFCAYPRTGFTQDAETSMREICAMHSRVISG